MLPEKSSQSEQRRVLERMRDFLEKDMRHVLDDRGIDASKYADTIEFTDPITNIQGKTQYLLAIQAIRLAMRPKFWVHSVKVAEPDQIKLRWTARCFLPVPVPFNLRDALAYELTGESTYTVDTRLGLITRHVDTWDALKPNQQAFFSNEGLRDVVATSTQAILQAAPALETPEYVVLKRTAKYEIRRYDEFLVAETSMGSRASPTGGSGFNTLADYIFGRNEGGVKMEMTTPVFTRAGDEGGRMSFVIERKMGADPSQLPTSTGAGVERRKETLGVVAAYRFGGWPTDRDVRMAEDELREQLSADGFVASKDSFLARYNDPFTPPIVRRNEVLVRVENWDEETFGPRKEGGTSLAM